MWCARVKIVSARKRKTEIKRLGGAGFQFKNDISNVINLRSKEKKKVIK